MFDAGLLRNALTKVGSHNAQGEKYLTDAAAELIHEGFKVQALAVEVDFHFRATLATARVHEIEDGGERGERGGEGEEDGEGGFQGWVDLKKNHG